MDFIVSKTSFEKICYSPGVCGWKTIGGTIFFVDLEFLGTVHALRWMREKQVISHQ